MKIIKTEIIDNSCVSVYHDGPRGKQYETVVHFDRLGRVAYGFAETAVIEGYIKAADIPDYIVKAAITALQ